MGDRLQWMLKVKRDPLDSKIKKTRVAAEKDDFDPDEALAAAIKIKEFLSERMLEHRQHFPENDKDDNAYTYLMN